MSTTPYVVLDSIDKSYGPKQVLDSLQLTIGQGEMLALLGPSGCGKTTSLRILAGLETQDSGTVTIAGKDVSRVPTRSRSIGIVFQSYSLFPHMNAVENVAYGLRLRGTDAAERTRRSQELLDMVGLAEHREKFPQQLSGGQQQRVALARALALQPEVLLLDEPLSALDAKVRVHLRDEIRRIQQQEGITTLLVTHDQEEALTMADRVGVMLAGRIEQLGTPHDLYAKPETPFISQFVGVVNKIPADVSDGVAHILNERLPVGNRDAVADGPVYALVRPEDTTVVTDPDGLGRVVDHTLRGPLTSLIIEHPAAPVPVRVDLASPAAAAFPVGTQVRLGLSRTRTVVAPRDEVPVGPAAALAEEEHA
ncbi:ABC transporter ATP-binding protein [Brachybacterium sp. UNK5269]|uniref:ABC transporter ATP-binding protein n=1 Tax=Brachybacterium sp. UNK5269 TaxID=3408576 RepID=UPI003BB12DB4